MCAPRPAPLPLPPLQGEGDRVSGGGVFRRAGRCKRTLQSRCARQLPLKGEPRTVCGPSLAFPRGGRWHGVAVTDEGRGQAGVSATPKQEVQTLISHQCAHWCQLPPREAKRLCAHPPSCAHRSLPPLQSGEGDRKAVVGFSRRTANPKRTPQSRYARRLPLKGEPRTAVMRLCRARPGRHVLLGPHRGGILQGDLALSR